MPASFSPPLPILLQDWSSSKDLQTSLRPSLLIDRPDFCPSTCPSQMLGTARALARKRSRTTTTTTHPEEQDQHQQASRGLCQRLSIWDGAREYAGRLSESQHGNSLRTLCLTCRRVTQQLKREWQTHWRLHEIPICAAVRLCSALRRLNKQTNKAGSRSLTRASAEQARSPQLSRAFHLFGPLQDIDPANVLLEVSTMAGRAADLAQNACCPASSSPFVCSSSALR